ncbi:MAG: nucleotidyltransferase domain-containing protein [Deltaproteobacteria bacterium]|jgi:predicted nucleotidyltransferase|nr:nucleotidyltransferase domain-containing protein [Deltaproteobacteria bacterium]
MKEIQIDPKHLEIIKGILGPHLNFTYVFGSRAKGTAKKYSDLDLVIKTTIDKTSLRKIQDHFEESDLPYKVDLIIWSETDDTFKNHIEKDLIKFA